MVCAAQNANSNLVEELQGASPNKTRAYPTRKTATAFNGDLMRVISTVSGCAKAPKIPATFGRLYHENSLAEGCEYFRLGALAVSPDGNEVTYSTDTNGSERFILQVIEICLAMPSRLPLKIAQAAWFGMQTVTVSPIDR